MERVVIPEAQRKPTFLVIDEAHEYFDENIDDLLIEARKYKVGCVLAHQFLDQTTTYLRSSLASSTATKLAARLSVADARFLAPNTGIILAHALATITTPKGAIRVREWVAVAGEDANYQFAIPLLPTAARSPKMRKRDGDRTEALRLAGGQKRR